jgi:hypothetical protein
VATSLFRTKRQRVNAIISAVLVCMFVAASAIYDNATKTPCDDNRSYTYECKVYLSENPEASALPLPRHEGSTTSANLRSVS